MHIEHLLDRNPFGNNDIPCLFWDFQTPDYFCFPDYVHSCVLPALFQWKTPYYILSKLYSETLPSSDIFEDVLQENFVCCCYALTAYVVLLNDHLKIVCYMLCT